MPITLQEYKAGIRTRPVQPTDGRKKRKKMSLTDYKKSFTPQPKAPEKPKPQTEFRDFPNAVKPAGGSEGRILPNGNLAYTTPSGTIWEYTKDGRRIVKLASQFGGGGWEDTGMGTGLIGTAKERQAKRDYAGIPEREGHQRDHIIPVSLGGISDSKTNIRSVLTKDNPADLETMLADKVQSGEMSLMEARRNIMTYKQEKFLGGEPDLNWLEKAAVNVADGVKRGGRVLAKPVKKAANAVVKNVKESMSGPSANQSLALQLRNKQAEKKGEQTFATDDDYEVDRLYNKTGINAAREAKGLEPIKSPQDAFMLSPMGKALNSPTGKKVISTVAEKTQDLGLKWWAAVQTDDPIVRKIFNREGQTYDQVLEELKAAKNNPNNGPVKRFLYALQDSGPQTLIGVGLSLITKGRDRGVLSSTYFGAISANEQLEKEGKITSPTKIAIDVAGDRLLTSRLESLFKAPTKTLIADIAKNFGIEGGTEVAQSIAKMGVDYQNAKTDEERAAIIELAKEYIKDGDAALEFAVGGFMGGGTTAAVNIASPGTPNTDVTDNTANISVGREDEEYVIEDGKLIVNEKPIEEAQESNNRKVLLEEAKKYKSAEEFVEALDEGQAGLNVDYSPAKRFLEKNIGNTNLTNVGFDPNEIITIYRGIDDQSGKVERKISAGDYVATTRELAESYTGDPNSVVEMQIKAKDFYYDETDGFTKEDFKNGLNGQSIEGVYNPEKPFTDNEMKQIWEEANKTQKQSSEPISKPQKVSVEKLSTLATNSIANEDLGIKPGAIERAKEELQSGKSFPIKVRTLENGKLFIEDGRHRLAAAIELGIKDIDVEDVTSLYDKNIVSKLSEVITEKPISKKALELTKANGGVTISLDGDIPTKGFSVATDKSTEKVIDQEEISEQDISDYIDEHWENLQKPGNYLGMWIDEGKVYLDVPTVFNDKVEAVKAGRDADQLGVFDLETFETINNTDYEKIINDGETKEKRDKAAVQEKSPKDVSRKEYKAEGEVNDLREFVLSKNKKATSAERAGIVRKFSRLENNIKGNPSQSELLKAQKYLTSNYKGKEVEYNGKTVKIVGSSYGLVGVKLKNGKIVYVMPKEIKAKKPTRNDVIKYIQEEAQKELRKEAKIYSFTPGKKIKVEEEPKVFESKAEPKSGDKTSKIARSVEAKAVEAGLTKGFEDVAGYESINLKEQAEIATKLVNNDIKQARGIIRGELPLPNNLKGTALVTAMEEYIKQNPDANLAYELANSPLISVTSEAAQELRLAAERTPDSATAKLLQIKKSREEVVSKDITKQKKKVKETIKEEVEKIHLSKEDQDWNKFLEAIKC